MEHRPVFRGFRALQAAWSVAVLIGCGGNPAGSDPGDGGGPGGGGSGTFTAPVKATVALGKVGVLSKTSAITPITPITLRRLILTAVSSATPADTVRDTSTVAGSGALTVQRVLKVKPRLAWTLRASTFDQRDSIIHRGESRPFAVEPADTAEVSLDLASRFATYQARFADLPDSVGAEGDGGRIGIGCDRLVLRIDGAVMADTALAPGNFFRGGQSVHLDYDYVTPGAHSVTLEAYGRIGQSGLSDAYRGLLFSGSADFNSAAGEDGSRPVILKWAGPDTGGSETTLILGRIGKVVLVGGFNPMQ